MDSRDNKVKMESGSSTNSYKQQQPDPLPCAKPCRSYGNPATDNLCSRCYKDYLEKLEQVKLEVKIKKMKASSKVDIPSTNPFPCFAEANNKTATHVSTKNNRCHGCNKRVGLLGFGCRCRGMFCSAHRYPEEHACNFDYKSQARIALAKENPLCKADKLFNRL
ncbi:zinc finger A20 and AN1 domain-containing stress-associated protein 10-like [Coffea eugenioides]|uniref:zinc finger A20 and AN1 domain-containing stress-associated protein 10-like n=1 Tax=Coffea eugenioides TaxID=49369 RepID=UPI000F5D1156|nr:zinc finger A20 and AN1 domain-containing stress-associated protein 10-like [Coffea arabica]XP_027162705.1 zinc finger A20 and AN1 domain-containing stress-associated protein 10-like [Coffea eugenioides]